MGAGQTRSGESIAEELEQHRQYFNSLLEISPVAIVTTDLDAKVTSWNPAAEALFGYRADDAVGRKIDDLIANRDDLHDESEAYKAETARTGRFHGISRRVRNDGTLVDVEIDAVAVHVGGEHVGYYAIYHDISDVQRQRRYYEALFTLSPTAIATIDRDDNVTSWNAAAERLFGYSQQEAIGRNIDDLVAYSEDLRVEGAALARQAEQTEVRLVTRRLRKDGSLVDVDLRAAPIVVGDEMVGMFCLYHDITELQRQKQYYESLLETSPAAIMTVDRDGLVTSWNPAAERLLGYSREEAIGRNIDDLVADRSDLREEAEEISRQASRGGQAHLVTKRTRKDGSLIDVDVVASSITVGGEQVGYYAIYSDVSEVQRQKRYYESLFELSPTAIATIDLDYMVTSWNAAAERLFGYSEEEALGRSIHDLIASTEELRSEGLELGGRAEHGEVHRVTRRLRNDGSLVDVDLRAAPIVVGGDTVGIFCLYHDISELQRQKRYYESLVDSSPIAIALLDANAVVTSWNPSAEELFGYTSKEAVGRHIDALVANSDDIREEAARYTALGMIEGDFAHAIARRTHKDGSLIDVEMFGAPVVVGGEPVGLYAMYHDIGDLQRARREAEAATETKSAFLATMSHEIRTPMNAVIGMTDLLLGTPLDDEQRSFAEVIRTSGEALLSVINDILDFSKIEAGRLELDRQPFDLRECVESALELVARSAAEAGLDLAYVLRPGTPEALVGDAARLRQILLNLLNNAVKFTERGEVVVRVDAERLAPAGGSEPDRDGHYRVHFAVADTGIGIPEERLGSLFESFTQIDTSTTRRYGGTGLGLAISKRLSELMGGTIWAESRPGEGSTFQFTIEADAAPQPVRAYDDPDSAPLAGLRVAIVDDNATNRQILRLQTESWGMIARDTESPAEALEWVRRGDPFDVAIVDMQMPELDGIAVAREIRRARDAERLPLILLTSLGPREEETGETLFAARLTKPIRPSQLYDVLLDVVGAKAAAAPEETPARLATDAVETIPLRVLVAEDNPVNRQLALLLLKKMGHRADVAVNGLEAVEAVERDGYDVVLMDVQMPEMDGLEATRTIHERLASRRPHIIAATANAMQDERERCLAAGMDDYLSKPIRLEQLAAALERVRPHGNMAAAPQRPEEERASSDVLDTSALEQLRATLGDAGAGELRDTFLAEAPKLISTLRQAAERGDADQLKRAAHTLKSNAATFGATSLAELARTLEARGETGSLEEANELVPLVEAEWYRVRSALEPGGESGLA